MSAAPSRRASSSRARRPPGATRRRSPWSRSGRASSSAATAAASCFGTSSCSRFWTPAAAASSFGRSASGIAFHAFFVMTVAPTTGARPMSSMFGVCRYHWNSSAASGVVGTAFDHAGRQAGHDVGHRHRARLEAVGLEPLHHAIVAGRGVELDLLQIGDGRDGLLGEELRPPAVSPVEQDEALRLDALARSSASASSVTSFSSS